MVSLLLISWLLFQSTLPYGSDPSKSSSSRSKKDFNPRSLTGATAYRVFIQGGVFVFQSTLPYGSDH